MVEVVPVFFTPQVAWGLTCPIPLDKCQQREVNRPDSPNSQVSAPMCDEVSPVSSSPHPGGGVDMWCVLSESLGVASSLSTQLLCPQMEPSRCSNILFAAPLVFPIFWLKTFCHCFHSTHTAAAQFFFSHSCCCRPLFSGCIIATVGIVPRELGPVTPALYT